MSFDTRWKKLFRDVTGNGGRALALLIAVSVGIFSVSTMLGAFGIVSREIPINYLGTTPAHATIEVDEVTSDVLATARSFPGIAVAEGRAVIEARAKVGDEWMRMLLFVVDDFNEMRLNTFTRDSGAWPPPTGSMLIERQAVAFLKRGEGKSLTVRMPHGATRVVPITGIVHDTTLAPAWQEQTGYGYITRDTLASLGQPPILDELRILLEGNPQNAAIVDVKALELADTLRAAGIEVHSIKVPPPGKHPHQAQMQISLRNFVILSSLGLVLSAILVAAVLAAILARQIREIGVMKAVGARSGQLARMYGLLMLVLGGLSLAVGLPLGVVVAGRLSLVMADSMNFTVTNSSVPTWVYAIVIGSGLLVPLLMSLPTILGATRATVREALGNVGVSASFGAGRLDRALTNLRGVGLPYLLAVRNMFRRRGRLVLALAMLSAGGGLFMTALNVRDGWRTMASHVTTDRFYDADFLLNEPVSTERIADALSSVSGIRKFEIWGASPAAFTQGEKHSAVMRTYPDRGHGSFTLFGVPPQTEMIKFPLLEGRWLAEGDLDAIVITQRNLKEIRGAKIGDRIVLSIGGQPTAWRLVGVVLEVGGGGGYVSSAGYTKAIGPEGTGGDIRLITSARTAEERDRVVRAAERALDEAGIGLGRSMPLERLYTAMVGHIEVPARILIATSLLLVLVGGLGVASMMTINVLERTREIGVMKAIGAAPTTIVKIITSEGLFIGALSWFLAVLISLPLTRALGLVGRTEMGTSLPFTVSIIGGAIWLGLVLAIVVAASATPASRAARLVAREALAYE